MEDASIMVLENKKSASTQDGDTLVGDGKDIMSILRQFGICLIFSFMSDCLSVRENALVDEAERLSESELLGQMRSVPIYDFC